MATSLLPILLSLLAATVSARPCKTLFYFSSTTTTTYYPSISHSLKPNNIPNSFLQFQNPRYFTVIYARSPEFRGLRPTLYFKSNPTVHDESKPSIPIKSYPVSSSIFDRTMDIMSVIGALLIGVGCGALTAATMFLVWSFFSPRSFDFDDVSDDDDENDDVTAFKKKLGYVAIPANPKVTDDDDLKKPVKEVV